MQESARLGRFSTIEIKVDDPEDEPLLSFANKRLQTTEPNENQNSILKVRILRSGDLTSDLTVRVSTKDGSARSGIHYEPFSKVFEFEAGVTYYDIEVVLLNSRSVSQQASSIYDNLDYEKHLSSITGGATDVAISTWRKTFTLEIENYSDDVVENSVQSVFSSSQKFTTQAQKSCSITAR